MTTEEAHSSRPQPTVRAGRSIAPRSERTSTHGSRWPGRLLAICGALLVLIVATSVIFADPESPPLLLIDSPFDAPRETKLYVVDPTSGAMTLRADLGSAHTPFLALAAASETVLYAGGTDPTGTLCQGSSCLLLEITLDPLTTTPVSLNVVGPFHDGALNIGEVTGLTFRADGSLYALSQTNSGIYVVDPTTGAATLVGISNVDLHGGDIAFDADDHLWAWTNGPVAGLYELDPDSAHATALDTSQPDTCAGLAGPGHSDIFYATSTGNDSLHGFEAGVGSTGVIAPLTLGGAPFDHKRGDLDSPFCVSGAFCDDGNLCTDDACEPGGCRHVARAGCCTSDAECEDGNPCTTDTCGAASTCVHEALTGGETTCGVGPCQRTVTACIDGAAQACEPGAPLAELCNGADDDCDGEVDEGVAAPSAVPTISLTGGAAGQLTWTAVSGATDYDVVRGSLGALTTSHGDFASSAGACAVSRFTGTSLDVTDPTSAGAGVWFLVRPGSCSARGTWDEPDPALIASRDAGIQAAPSACP